MSMDKPVLLYVIGGLDVGGSERHLIQILPRIAEKGFTPLVYILTHRGDLCAELEMQGIPVLSAVKDDKWHVSGKLRKAIRLMYSAFILVQVIYKEQPHIIHFFLPSAYLVGGLCTLLTRKSLRVMSRRSLRVYQDAHPVLAKVERLLHFTLNAALANSVAVYKELSQEGIPSSKIGVIYNGVDPEPFTKKLNRNEMRKKLGINEKSLVYVIVANLIDYKGHRDLIRAFSIIHGVLPNDWILLCVGKDTGIGATLAILTMESGLQSHIRWLGQRSDVPAILQVADIGVLCSHQEGFSNSILECMLAGLPMVVTNVGGNPEVVLDKRTGFVIPPRDPKKLAEALLQLSRDPELRNKMGSEGRTQIINKYLIDKCVDEYVALYRGLLTEPHKPICEILDAENSSQCVE